MKYLKGKVAFATGGSSGIGQGIVKVRYLGGCRRITAINFQSDLKRSHASRL
jgi:NAD(P)-dependent dehydrogenase (short-subunit alcohol dehydrogenase family)